jgi:23S rRNA (guanine745-N1)-methyltransferase
MSFLCNEHLACPLDQLTLEQIGNSLHCESGHSFDIARQGYVNFLGSGDKRSRDPGDSKEMVTARRDFLGGNHYQPVAERLAELILSSIDRDAVIVDAGCGEGYYLDFLQSQLEKNTDTHASLIGFDISKWAIQAAARRFAATWLVASNRNIPIAQHSADCVLSVFGFPMFDSFERVLRDDGVLWIVHAGPRHLIELREIIYPSVKKKTSSILEQGTDTPGFTVVKTTSVQFVTAPLCNSQIGQLLTMTPHLFRASHEGKKRAALLDNFPVTVDVVFQQLRKSPPAKSSPTDSNESGNLT